jgi:hypothetical protein
MLGCATCLDGQTNGPYEQKTRQSPGFALNAMPLFEKVLHQFVHSGGDIVGTTATVSTP